MNPSILSIEVQNYLQAHASQSPAGIALKKSPFDDISSSELAEQIDARQRLKSKLPHWLEAKNIYFPPRQNAEQCSSEATARYKASLAKGKRAIDLTGGFGVDSWALSQQFEQVDYCEMNESLFELVKHNFQHLGVDNIYCHLGDSLAYLKAQESYELIYLDPARRDEHNRKMVSFSDCVPDMVAHQDLLFAKAKTILLKASPMMDISLALKELNSVREVHVVALKNECKELLFLLESGFSGEPEVKCVNLIGEHAELFSFTRAQEKQAIPTYGQVQTYLYEPNAAVLKAGAFNVLSATLGLEKLHPSTHLYTSTEKHSDFPGKVYQIETVLEYNKKTIVRALPDKKANVKTYNFANTPEQVKKKLGLKDGGDSFLFGVKTNDDNYQLLLTRRA